MSVKSENSKILKKLLFLSLMMFGFGFAMVPFYNQICSATGLDKDRVPVDLKNTQVDESRWVTVQFDSNTIGNIPWRFVPLQNSLRVHPGELKQVEYRVVNTADQAITGQAIPSYGPAQAALYFKKIQCFCFTEQTMKAKEERVMPVVFVVLPSLPSYVHTITLSYTFHEISRSSGAG